jgi:hypothetical protein
MQALMEEHGFSADEFNETFDLLKEDEGILKYNRSAPRGYCIEMDEAVHIDTELPIESQGTITVGTNIESESQIVQPKSEESKSTTTIDTDISSQNEVFLNVVKKNQPVSSKAKLLELAESINIDNKSAESIIEQLKELGILQYSRSSPRGWSVE